mgnify:CR=1 FL=1|jgi:hypothetical protein
MGGTIFRDISVHIGLGVYLLVNLEVEILVYPFIL